MLFIVLALIVGGVVGYIGRIYIALARKKSSELEVKQSSIKAKEEARKIIEKAEQKADSIVSEMKKKEENKEKEFQKTRDHLEKREEVVDKRQMELDKEYEKVREKIEAVKQLKEQIAQKVKEKEQEIEKVAKMTKEEALEILMKDIEKEHEEDLMVRINKVENTSKEKLERKAREILTTVIQRLSSSTASELTTTTVSIPSDEIKGKIIGKEGRNIRAFERASGVEVIVDDTPGSVVISSFDPVRRQVARLALENLILDGRIQPAKIEDFISQAKDEINAIIKEKGDQAVQELGIYNLDPRIVSILGRLWFRTSYGQNVLQHSIEMAHLAGMLAEELGADVKIAKAGALVHDIGKALDHEVQGTHIEIGIRILEKFGADPKIVTAMKSHHDDYPHGSIEAVIVQVCDYISGSRPGARRDTLENYIKRLQDLEAVANGFSGVDKSYALSAGREIRVFVEPKKVSDLEAYKMARDIAKKIEADLTYPGEIKVTVIRENRVIEFAR